MDYAQIILFAIDASIRLGTKLKRVYEEEVRDKPVILPPVEGTTLPTWDEVEPFFLSEKGQQYVAETPEADGAQPLGMYAALWQRRQDMALGGLVRKQLIDAYVGIQAQLEGAHREYRGAYREDTQAFLTGTNALFVVKQWSEGTDPKRHPIQRIAGTIVEIAIDYAKIDPRLFGSDGRGDRIARAFLDSLSDLDFAETELQKLVLDVFEISLRTLSDQSGTLLSKEHLSRLLKAVTWSLAEGVKNAGADPDKLRALYRFRREILQDVLKTSASVVSEQSERFFGKPGSPGEAVYQSVLKGALAAIQAEPNLFSNVAAKKVFAAALTAAGENAKLLFPSADGKPTDAYLSALLTALAKQVADAVENTNSFSGDELADLAVAALEITAANAPRLVGGEDPGRQLLGEALQRTVAGLSLGLQQDGGPSRAIQRVLSRQHLIDLARLAFGAVARDPRTLLGDVDADPKRSALAQIIGSVAQAVADDADGLLNGNDAVQLFHVAFQAFARNPDRLLGGGTGDVRQQILSRVMSALVISAQKNRAAGGRNLLSAETLIEAIRIAIASVSGNVDGFLREPEIVSMVADRLLHAASNLMRNQLDAPALLALLGPLLNRALEGREVLDASDADLIVPFLKAA